ncbi:MAG TPA: nitroreductase/quinone reductase family protein [Solirubrobacterales bacterium]|nr:nitroreductase/quinone reductase family protein [Solirubrobacterales bacterium]
MRAGGKLRYVDPGARRGAVYRAWAALVASPAGLWLSRHIGWHIDPHLLRLTGGRLGTGLIIPTVLLETRGARSGQVRRNGVIYFHDGEQVILVASKAGAPENPSWFHNARANPAVELNGLPYQAEVIADEAERERVWRLADRVFPPFASYRRSAGQAGRTIPILRLSALDRQPG